MNKKLYIPLILAIILVPIALADIMSGMEDALGSIFDTSGDLAFVKAGLWIVLFFVLFKSLEKILSTESRGMAAILALVIAMIATRYMPNDYVEYLGGGYALILGFIFLLVPYFLGSTVGDFLNFQKKGKTFLIIIFYALFSYGLMEMKTISCKGGPANLFCEVVYWMIEHDVWVLIAIGILCVWFLLSAGKKEEDEEGGETKSKQSIIFYILLLASIGLVGYAIIYVGPIAAIAAAIVLLIFWLLPKLGQKYPTGPGKSRLTELASSGKDWMGQKISEKRQKSKMRAMLKAGRAKKEAKLEQQITKMPKGKYIKKGTSGYDLLRKRQQQLAKIRKKQGKKPGFKI